MADRGAEKDGEVGVKITPEMIAEDEHRWYARDVIMELSYCGNYMRDRKDMTNLDIRFYAYLMRKAHDMLKAQEPRALTKSKATSYPEKQNAFSDSDKAPLYVEYKKPRQYFVKWVTADSVYLWMNDIEFSLDYGKEYRFWTSRPTEKQRKEVKWDA